MLSFLECLQSSFSEPANKNTSISFSEQPEDGEPPEPVPGCRGAHQGPEGPATSPAHAGWRRWAAAHSQGGHAAV